MISLSLIQVMLERPPKKILIIGLPGSGKSTFAHSIAKKIKLPVYHLDKYLYTSGWVEKDWNSILTIQKKIVSQSEWIIDGNNIHSLELRYNTAHLVVYLKYSRLVCIYRVIKRIFCKNHEIDDRAEGCSELFKWWLIKYIWQFKSLTQSHIDSMIKRYPNVKVITITSDNCLLKLEEELISAQDI